MSWKKVRATGSIPSARSHFSSSVIRRDGVETELVIYGGQNNSSDLYDCYILDLSL